MEAKRNIRAVIWDYDGTLADTRSKNLNVTRQIVARVTGTNSNEYTALQSLTNYNLAITRTANWRDLYKQEFGFTDRQTDDAGGLWTEYQLQDKTLVPFYGGIPEVIRELQNLTHGIVSQNSRHVIARQLSDNELNDYFASVIGYEAVPFAKQKPQPDGLILCIEELTQLSPGKVLYIGDHETDARCAFNANQIFRDKDIDIVVISVGAFYSDGTDDSNWSIKPNFKARDIKDIIKIIHYFE